MVQCTVQASQCANYTTYEVKKTSISWNHKLSVISFHLSLITHSIVMSSACLLCHVITPTCIIPIPSCICPSALICECCCLSIPVRLSKSKCHFHQLTPCQFQTTPIRTQHWRRGPRSARNQEDICSCDPDTGRGDQRPCKLWPWPRHHSPVTYFTFTVHSAFIICVYQPLQWIILRSLSSPFRSLDYAVSDEWMNGWKMEGYDTIITFLIVE